MTQTEKRPRANGDASSDQAGGQVESIVPQPGDNDRQLTGKVRKIRHRKLGCVNGCPAGYHECVLLDPIPKMRDRPSGRELDLSTRERIGAGWLAGKTGGQGWHCPGCVQGSGEHRRTA